MDIEDPLSCSAEEPVEDIKVEDFDASCVDEDTAAEHDSNGSQQEDYFCPLCPNKYLNVRTLKAHLAWIHYGETILEASGSSPRTCGKCNFKLTSKHKQLGKDIVLHLMSKHGYLYKVVPDDLAARLLQMDCVGKGWKEMHICNGTAPEGSVNCPYCSMPIKRYDVLVEHIVSQHHLDEILSSSGCVNTDSCNICARKFTNSNRKSIQQKLASHLALAHGYLNTVLTAEVKSELARAKEYISRPPRGKGPNLREKKRNLKSPCSKEKPTVTKTPSAKTVTKKQKRSRKQQKKHAKDKTKSVGQTIIPDNIKERLAAFTDAQNKGEVGEEPNSEDMLNDDGTSKSFLTSTQLIEWQCYLCFHKAKGLHQLKTHLATRHFRAQVLFFWQNDENYEKPCKFCQKVVFTDISLALGRKEFFAINHLIHVHDILYHIANEHIKKGLDEFNKPIIVCPICQAGQISKAELELHLLLDHYREKIRTASNSTSAQCGICNVKFHWRRTTLRHIAKQHRELIHKVLDPDVLEYLEQLNESSQAVFIKEESDSNVGDDQINFVDIDSILVKSKETLTEQVKVEPSETLPDGSFLEATAGPSNIDPDVLADLTAKPITVNPARDDLEEDVSEMATQRNTSTDEDLSDIVVTNHSSK